MKRRALGQKLRFMYEWRTASAAVCPHRALMSSARGRKILLSNKRGHAKDDSVRRRNVVHGLCACRTLQIPVGRTLWVTDDHKSPFTSKSRLQVERAFFQSVSRRDQRKLGREWRLSRILALRRLSIAVLAYQPPFSGTVHLRRRWALQ